MISKDMIVFDVLEKYPKLENVFKNNGIRCFGWGGALYMSIERAARMYGVNLENLLKDLNNKINQD